MSIARVESLDHDGRGVAHCDGKVVFIEGGLPGEEVEYSSYRVKPSYEQAVLSRVLRASPLRVTPRCEFFGVCGGCSMQHLEHAAQVAAKQRVLENALWHIARVRPGVVYAPIHGPAWRYRDRARLSIRCVPSKGGVLVGFHEKKSSYIADMRSCEILPAHVSALIEPLRKLVGTLSIPECIPQAEVAVCETHTVLVLRHLQPFTRQDEARLLAFGEKYGVHVWHQPGGPDTARPLRPNDPLWLEYSLPEFGVSLRFRPADFTQVNVHINRLLMRRAMQLLDPQPGELVADLFCGLGNFSLPIASRGARVIGVEGSEEMVKLALDNARRNGLAELCSFQAANLFEASPASLAALGALDKLLIDPPREGAVAVCKALGESAPGKIVYVSCNPATLARDAAILVHEKGYQLAGAGVANMFPQTSHVESIALFERGSEKAAR